jgi:hypothetical protein
MSVRSNALCFIGCVKFKGVWAVAIKTGKTNKKNINFFIPEGIGR